MYGYGYRYSIRPGYVPFNPLTDIDGLQLYLNKNTNVNTKVAADFVSANSEYLSSSSTDFDKGDEDFSFGQWVKFDSLGTAMPIMGKWGNSTNKRSYDLRKNSVDSIQVLISSDGTTTTALNSGTTASASTWYFVMVVYDSINDLIKISVNGGAFVTAAHSGGPYVDASPVPLYFGRDEAATYFDGTSDAVPFYNKALTLAEVQALYNSGNGVDYNDLTTAQKVDLVEWWRLNETSGNRSGELGHTLTDNNTVGYALGKVQEVTESGELVFNWIDQSSNAFVFSQDTVTKQPLLSANSIDFDGTDDSLENSTSNVFSGDSSGIIFFSGYLDNATHNMIIASSDNTGIDYSFALRILSTGYLSLFTKDSGVSKNKSCTTTQISNGAFYYGYVKSTGTAYEFNLNGVTQSFTGTDDGEWFADITLRDNLVLGSGQTSPASYGNAKINKVIYSNDHTIDTTPILNFLSNPDN
jgi:hypothetical protein